MAFSELVTCFVTSHPYQLLLGVLLGILVLNRIVTGFAFYPKPITITKTSSPAQSAVTVPVIPYSIPWIGHTIPFALGFPSYIAKLSKKYNAGAFSLVIAGQKHNMVTSPGLTKALLDGRNIPINNYDLIYRVMETFWDDRGATRRMPPDMVWGELHGWLVNMMREDFINPGLDKFAVRISDRIWNLASSSRRVAKQSVWERAGEVKILKGDSSNFVVEADLFKLMREFVGDIACEVLMGHKFMENNPNVLSDLWLADTKFNQFLLGVPYWAPGMAEPSRARDRLVKAIGEHHLAYIRKLKGEDPGEKWNDLSDTSNVIVGRLTTLFNHGIEDQQTHGGINGAIVWAMNVNANVVIYWMLWYICSDPKLLQEIRDEVKPFVTRRKGTDESPKIDLNLHGLKNDCPLLSGVFLETMRLEAAGVSYKKVEEDFAIAESEGDAKSFGRPHALTYAFRKGELLCMPHAAHQGDDYYWPDAEKFDPRRFWTRNPEKADAPVKVEYRTMKVWGGGKSQCKGRKVAEYEVLLFVAAVVSCWNIEPAENGGKWVFPGRVPSAGTGRPKQFTKVKMWRRNLDEINVA